jgi:nitroreductase
MQGIEITDMLLILDNLHFNKRYMNTFLDGLQWRYATKRMTGEKISDESLAVILEAIRLAPTSLGLQPFFIFVISNRELKEKISPLAYNQPQITESSHLLVFAAKKDISPEFIDEYMKNIAETRNTTVDSLAGFRSMIDGFVSGNSAQIESWSGKQAYIALGFALAAAALEKVDATPMEGFSPDGVDEVLGLKEKGLRSVCLLALGKRNEQEDSLVHAAKVRRSEKDLFTFLA